jgi:hypothetical protein
MQDIHETRASIGQRPQCQLVTGCGPPPSRCDRFGRLHSAEGPAETVRGDQHAHNCRRYA